MSLLGHLQKLIEEHGSSSILKERLAWLREQVDALEHKVRQSEEESTRLKKQVGELENRLSEYVAREQFVEHRGALFKRKPGGGYLYMVFCPNCRGTMASMFGDTPYTCRCGVFADFTGGDLDRILHELPE